MTHSGVLPHAQSRTTGRPAMGRPAHSSPPSGLARYGEVLVGAHARGGVLVAEGPREVEAPNAEVTRVAEVTEVHAVHGDLVAGPMELRDRGEHTVDALLDLDLGGPASVGEVRGRIDPAFHVHLR